MSRRIIDADTRNFNSDSTLRRRKAKKALQNGLCEKQICFQNVSAGAKVFTSYSNHMFWDSAIVIQRHQYHLSWPPH